MTHSSWLIQKSAEAIFCYEQLLFAQQLTWKWFLALLLFLIIVQICHERRFSDDESLFIFFADSNKVCLSSDKREGPAEAERIFDKMILLSHSHALSHTHSNFLRIQEWIQLTYATTNINKGRVFAPPSRRKRIKVSNAFTQQVIDCCLHLGERVREG